MPEIVPRNIPELALRHLLDSGHPSALAKIFAARGITDNRQLETSLAGLLPFDNLKNIHEMARHLADAIAAQDSILVIADYDADGATACAVAVRGLRAFGAHIDFLVPNRFEYGYGLTPEIVRLAARSEPDILLTVDNGIASIEGVAEANQLGMRVLVTDHHLPADALPDAASIVNPNQRGCAFPDKHLAGVGVMFYVLLALRAELRARGTFTDCPEPRLAELLDLVALGTVADVVKLGQNNRILVQQGLQRIRAGRACAGIKALLQVARKDPAHTSSQDLGFAVGPRLNAAGRLDDMSLGIECLLSDDAATAMRIATRLDALNRERRTIETDMQEAALAALESVEPSESFSLALFDENWHQGVIGILASRLKDKFHRPTIAFARANDGELKGSGRSISGLHLRDALDLVSKRHPALIRKFGGHAAAAGLSIAEADFDRFASSFEQVASELLDTDDLTQRIETDGSLEHADMTLETARLLEDQVWGQGFPAPQFNDDFIVQGQRVVGEKHLKLRLGIQGRSMDAILFGQSEPLPERVHLVYSLGVNEYNGTQDLQLIVRQWQHTKG
ncbi:MAG: single-stranded-DNA-specific exonuclease RecJ [Nitrosomonadales bacterium]|nr:single-stranded-DNA-specific exonuclease RecJ [Nitrosomonadales bacterium]